jgi:tripartite-type tricarboxylate transporter receptor subunit TctC
MFSQSVVVDNRPGGGTIIGAEMAAKSPPDGYTLYVSSPTIVINHGLHAKLPYDAIRDFSPVSQWVSFANLLVVHPSLPVNSVRELIAYAKARPGQINYASSGNGATTHLGMELLKTMAGIDLVHLPYKGSAPAMSDLLGGRVSLMLDAGATSTPQVKAGKLRALAVTGATRSPLNPDLPTIAETVPGYDSSVWIGMFVPAGTPRDIIDRLYSTISTILKMPDVRERLLAQEMEPVGSTPEQFTTVVRQDLEKWRTVIKAANVRVD